MVTQGRNLLHLVVILSTIAVCYCFLHLYWAPAIPNKIFGTVTASMINLDGLIFKRNPATQLKLINYSDIHMEKGKSSRFNRSMSDVMVYMEIQKTGSDAFNRQGCQVGNFIAKFSKTDEIWTPYG